MIKEAIIKLSKKEDLSYEMAQAVMDEIMSGEANDIQKSAYLTALAMKGETIDEITASAAGMREHCTRLLNDMDVLEIVGTGGDRSNSFNISTTSALVISAGGVPVAKHGNRAASSKCGAADVLEALGVNITVSPAQSAQMLKDINICFLFAQKYHTAMRYVANVRKELGIRTVFNILGPLSNPAGANMQVMGVYDEKLVEPLARVLSNLGVKNAMVVYGQDCLDEISMSARTSVCEIKDGKFRSYEIEPEQFGFKKCDKEELVGGTPEENAKITLSILNGEKGPRREAVLMNAGAGLYVGGKVNSLKAGVDLAAFNNRLRFTLDVYKKNSKDLVLQTPLPVTTGYLNIYSNVGELENKGIEISLGGRIIATKDFSWDLDVNWATNKNKLKSLYGGIKERMNDASNPLNAGWWVGKPLGTIYTYRYEGIWQWDDDRVLMDKMKDGREGGDTYYPGENKIADLDGDGQITTNDREIVGYTDPKGYGGISTTLNYGL